MAKIENITNKLREDADQKIDKIFSDARQEAESAKENILKRAEKEADKIIKDSQDQGDRLFDQKISSAKIDRRDSKIQEQQNYINRVFNLVVEKLSNISDQDFLKQIESVTKNIDQDYEILVPRDRVNFLKSKGLNVSKENVSDGFVVRTSTVDYNNSYTDLVESYKQELIGEISDKFLSEI